MGVYCNISSLDVSLFLRSLLDVAVSFAGEFPNKPSAQLIDLPDYLKSIAIMAFVRRFRLSNTTVINFNPVS